MERNRKEQNTSLAATEALAYLIQSSIAWNTWLPVISKMVTRGPQNGQWDLERGPTLGYQTKNIPALFCVVPTTMYTHELYTDCDCTLVLWSPRALTTVYRVYIISAKICYIHTTIRAKSRPRDTFTQMWCFHIHVILCITSAWYLIWDRF